MIFTEAMCLGVLLDSLLTFAVHARFLSGKNFYHLRQMNTVHISLMENAAVSRFEHFIEGKEVELYGHHVMFCGVGGATVDKLTRHVTAELG